MKRASMLFLTRLVWLFSVALLIVPDSFASKNRLRFLINAPGSPPFIYFNNEQSRYQGVVVDFFDSFDTPDAFNVEYIDSSRARNEQLVEAGKADLFLGSSIWMTPPDRFIYSDFIMSHNSYMYAITPFGSAFAANDHERAHVCTRYDYKYPSLDPYFKQNKLIRVDSSSQETMTHMLAKGRCQFAIMSDENARAVMFSQKFCNDEFYQSPVPVSEVNISFIMNRNLLDARAKINKQLGLFIESGDRDRSIQKHVGARLFPKRVCAK